MVNLTDAREAIYEAFITAWASTSAITLDGEAYDPPTAAFVRLAVRHNDSAQESLGGVGRRRFLRAGIVYVQCFAPKNAGARAADTLAAAAVEILEGVHLSNHDLRIMRALTREIGPDEDGRYQINVEAAFDYTQTR